MNNKKTFYECFKDLRIAWEGFISELFKPETFLHSVLKKINDWIRNEK